jgi:hypothetical protein
MNPSRQILRIAPIEKTCCFQLYSLLTFVATAFDVDLLSYRWHEKAQEFEVHLRGERAGLLKVCLLAGKDQPRVKVRLEALDDQMVRSLN